jgi:ELWxxDGT repeat protein
MRIEVLEDRCLLAVALVDDINEIANVGGNPTQFTAVGNTAYFAAYDVTRGSELWKTDGTASGTKFVKDIYLGATGAYANSSEPQNLTALNGTLFFTAFHPDYGRELWKSNGSGSSTKLVKDIALGTQNSLVSELTKSGSLLYFRAYDPTNGFQLWKSDGTSNGTSVATQIDLGASPTDMTDVNGTLYFVGDAVGDAVALYRITSGSISTVPIPLSGIYSIEELENVGGALYFTTRNTNGDILWRTDGVTTRQIANTPPGFENQIASLTNANGVLYATVGGSSLYKYDVGKVTLLRTIIPGHINSLTVVGNKVFFAAFDNTYGRQLWVTQGTQASTKIVEVIGSGTSGTPQALTNVDGVLYFVADDGINGRELWKSDGTAAGTKMVEDLFPGAAGSNPAFITHFNGRALFQALDVKKGAQVFKSNGTASGTFRISNLNPSATADAFPSNITDVAGLAYFFVDDGIHGRELWKSDGTSLGTALVKDINPGLAGSEPRTSAAAVNVNGTLYFVANDGQRGAELWKSNASGTFLAIGRRRPRSSSARPPASSRSPVR